MNEKRAREILGDSIQEDGSLYDCGRYLIWGIDEERITLDSRFTVADLEAIIWWMKEKGADENNISES